MIIVRPRKILCKFYKMKVINLSLDKNILDKNSAVAQRAFLYEQKLDKYLVLTPNAGNKILSFFKLYFFLKQTLKAEQFDLITIQDIYFLPLITWFLQKKDNFKVEIQVHGFEKFNFLRKSLFKYNIKKADLIRVVSLRLKKELVNNFKVAENTIYIAPVAVDKNKFQNLNLANNKSEIFTFLTAGRLVAVKNIALQIKALAAIKEDCRLIIVGSGVELDNLKSLVKKLNLEKRVSFIDWSDKLLEFYQQADCFLLTSNSEGYAMVIAEAILADLPVIMTDVGVAGDLVEDNINGFVIPVNNLELLTEKMSTVISDDDLVAKFRNNANKFKDKILAKEELINKVIDNWKLLCK